MTPSQPLSAECVERLHVWVKAHCPCLLEENEFMPGLFVIVEEEVKDALRRERMHFWDNFIKPCQQ